MEPKEEKLTLNPEITAETKKALDALTPKVPSKLLCWRSLASFDLLNGWRIDFKQAMLEMIFGRNYFSVERTRYEQLTLINKLLKKLGTKEDWQRQFIENEDFQKQCRATFYVESAHHTTQATIFSSLQTWENHIGTLRNQFSKIKADYLHARDFNRDLTTPVPFPVMTYRLDIIFNSPDLARYVLLFEPNFPADLIDIKGPIKSRAKGVQEIMSPRYVCEIQGYVFDWSKDLQEQGHFWCLGEKGFESLSLNTEQKQAQKQAEQTELQTQIISALQNQPPIEITWVPSKPFKTKPITQPLAEKTEKIEGNQLIRPPAHLWMMNVPLRELALKPLVYWLMAFKEIAWKTREHFYNIDPVVWGDEAAKEQAISEDFQHCHKGREQYSEYLTGEWESLYSEDIHNLRRIVEENYKKRSMVGIRDLNLNQILAVDGGCYLPYYEGLYHSVLLHPLSFFDSLPLTEANSPKPSKAQIREDQRNTSISHNINEEKLPKKVICYYKDAKTVEYGKEKVLYSKRKLCLALFEALLDGKKLHRDRLKPLIWPTRAPENWEKELHNTATNFRKYFNDLEPDLGNQLLPDANDSVYQFNLTNIEILQTSN